MLQSSLWDCKNSDMTLTTQVLIVKVIIFPVAMHRYESWTIKKAEHQRTDAFKLWCWRIVLKVLWPARISNQSILKEINPEYSLEGLMLKLKLQYFGHLMWRVDSLGKFLMLGKLEGRRRRQCQRLRWTNSVDVSLSRLWERVKGPGSLVCCSPWDRKGLNTAKQNNKKWFCF